MNAPLDRVAKRLGVTIEDHHSLGGGSINAAARLVTSGGDLFCKWNATPSAFFSTEATGLEALRDSGTSLMIPKVLAFEDPTKHAPGFLVTNFLEPGARRPDFDEVLGRGLAELHRATWDAFGFPVDTYCGATTQPNPETPRWVDFYREHRLAHQLALGRAQRLYGRTDTRAIESLLARLDELLDDDEPPALIHGDLWTGNLHAAHGNPALIDPAVYYGHREAEIGMMTLFGGFSSRVFDAYEELYPLREGWRERNDLYQLYHVMNHATLFGGGYVGQAMGIVRRYATT